MLADLLTRDGRFDWRNEIFEIILSRFEHRFRRMGELPLGRDAAAEAALFERHRSRLQLNWETILGSMLQQLPAKEGRIMGFEVKFFHLALARTSVDEMLSILAKFGFDRIVVLKRNNYLRKVVSSLILHEHRAVSRDRTTPGKLNKVRLDVHSVPIDRNPRPLLEHFRLYDEGFTILESRLQGRPHLWLSYEEDVEQDPLIAYRKVCEFLGFEPRDLEPRLQRVNPASLSSIIVNHGEVASYLASTPYAWMAEG